MHGPGTLRVSRVGAGAAGSDVEHVLAAWQASKQGTASSLTLVPAINRLLAQGPNAQRILQAGRKGESKQAGQPLENGLEHPES